MDWILTILFLRNFLRRCSMPGMSGMSGQLTALTLAKELKNRGVASITTDRPKLIADNL